jgi:hypothetical protein
MRLNMNWAVTIRAASWRFDQRQAPHHLASVSEPSNPHHHQMKERGKLVTNAGPPKSLAYMA